ncbi:MAG: hypothetical protein J6U33_00520 [Paludibacteraceae bacterium]|nr:hypothetical protein [Paludibacteraceae bacterium]
MKKFLLLMLLSVATIAQAAWQPDNVQTTRIDALNSSQGLLRSVRTPDGQIVVTWVNLDLGVTTMSLQIFDADGTAKFADQGLTVNNRHSKSYFTTAGLALASNGDILMAFDDSRDDPNVVAESSDVFAYRYSQTGTSVWSADGIKMTQKKQHDDAQMIDFIMPDIVASGDNVYFTAIYVEYVEEKDEFENIETNTYYYFQVMCLNANGDVLSNEVFPLNYAFYKVCAAPEGDIYVVMTNDNLGFRVLRLGSDGTRAWANDADVEPESQLVGNSVMHFMSVDTVSDGSLYLTYTKPSYSAIYQVVRKVTPTGSCALSEKVVVNCLEYGWVNDAAMAIKHDSVLVLTSFGNDLNSNESDFHVIANMLSGGGSYLWADEKSCGVECAVNEGTSLSFDLVDVVPQQNGWVVVYGDRLSPLYEYKNYYVHKIDNDGNTIWKKRVLADNLIMVERSLQYDDNSIYLFFTQGMFGGDGLYVACIDIRDGSNVTALEESKSDGIRTDAPKKIIDHTGSVYILHNDKKYNLLGTDIERQ